MICIIWAAGVCGAAAQASPLTAEQTAELYYRAWLNYDRTSALRLQREWGASNGGINYIDLKRTADPIGWTLKHAMSRPPAGAGREQLKLFARLMVEASKRVRCQAEAAHVGAQLPTGSHLARVELACAVPDAVPALRQLRARAGASEIGGADSMPSTVMLRGMVDAFATAPLTRQVATEIVLTGDADKRVWRAGPTELGVERVSADLSRQLVQAGFLQ
ncbi:hypothetical protein ACQKLX_09750 [Bosea sp. NPDC003192]|uniref:hypothetical protein n=1 Tax=Bosea sp. NPDC003192 TaxID=3390551 RepID=UPI003D01F31F